MGSGLFLFRVRGLDAGNHGELLERTLQISQGPRDGRARIDGHWSSRVVSHLGPSVFGEHLPHAGAGVGHMHERFTQWRA